MKYREGAELDPSQVKRGGGGAKIALGGGAGLIVLVVALLLGVDPSQLGSLAGGDAQPGPSASDLSHCRTTDDQQRDRECRFVAYTNSIQTYWQDAYSGYRPTSVTLFSDRVNTACGTATSAVGPFYCPNDELVYLDTTFFDAVLEGQLGATSSDAVEAYVIAHEIGHHVQNLTGAMSKANKAGAEGANSGSVRLELQADCYAGAWFANAAKDPQSPIAEITESDLKEALASAAAIGDDRIQEQTQGRVSPESWTHGSAAQRQKWLLAGYQSGDPNSCDTFAAKTLG